MLKRILASVLLLAFGAAIVGCEASASVDPNGTSNTNNGSYEKKTTTVKDSNGDTHTKTEVHSENR